MTLETENGAAVIAQIEPRKNVFVRPPVANLDVLFLVASTTQLPPARWFWISFRPLRWIRRTAGGGVYQKRPCRGGFSGKCLCKVHPPFIRIDYESGAGLDEVKQWNQRQIVRFLRQLRCGQIHLLNALLPDAARETSAISQKLGRGRHTTREVTIFEPTADALPTRRALPAWRRIVPGSSPRRIWSTLSRNLALIWDSASLPAAPTAAKKAVLCGKRWQRANFPRPGTTATAPCTTR